MKLLHDNHTRELVKKHVGSKLVSYTWVLELKERILVVKQDRFKARLIARGFTQEKDIVYNDVFSLVKNYGSI